MGAGFFMMVFAAVVMFKIADADKRRGWMWSGLTAVCIMVLSKATGLGIPAVFIGFFLTFLALVFTSPGKGVVRR